MTTVTVSPATVNTDTALQPWDNNPAGYFKKRPHNTADYTNAAPMMSALEARRARAKTWDPTKEWDRAHWLAAVEASDLPLKVKATARVMAADATSRGYTTIPNQTLANLAGVTRDATMTARLDRLRAAGFVESIRRFNNSSYQRLTNPVGIDPHPLDMTATDLIPLAPGEVF